MSVARSTLHGRPTRAGRGRGTGRSHLRTAVVAVSLLLGASVATPAVATAPSAPSPEHPRPPVLERYTPHPPAPAPDREPVAVPDPVPAPAARPAGREVLGLRTARSQTFAQADGSYVTQLYSAPRFYQPEGSSAWQPIELALHTVSPTVGGPDALADHGPVTLALRGPRASAGFLSLAADGHAISFRFPDGAVAANAAARPALVQGGAYAEYADVLPGGIDLRVFPRADGVKSFLVLPSRPAQTSFTFIVDAPGLSLAAQDDGSLAFVDESGATVGLIPRPYLLDSTPNTRAGAGVYSDAVHLSLGRSGEQRTVTITPDPAYLASAIYPVYLDPTVTNFPADAGSVSDTFVSGAAHTTNFNTYQRPDSPYYHELWVGDDPATGHAARTFIAFPDLASVLGTAHVESAVLSVLPYHAYSDAPTVERTWIRRLNTAWNASTVTWNTQPTYPNAFKLMPAGDDAYADLVEGQSGTFDITRTVRAWLDGSWPNDGVAIYEVDHESDPTLWKRLIASEQSGGNGPSLAVTWHRPVATAVGPTGGGWFGDATLTWTYDDGDATGDWPESGATVQVATSSSFSNPLLNVPVAGTSYHATGLADGTTYWWRVRVADSEGGTSDWTAGNSFKLDATSPVAAITSPAQDATVSGTVTLSGTASDASTFNHYTLEYGAGTYPQTWTAIGTNPYTSPVTAGTLGSWDTSGLGGIYTVRLRVYDATHQSSGFGEVLRRVRVGTGPAADLQTPVPGSYLPGMIRSISGTATASDLVSYTLSRGAGCSPTSWTTLTTSSTPVTNGTLGQWQSANLADGGYTIRLVVTASGGSATATSCVYVDNSNPTPVISAPDGTVVDADVDFSGEVSDGSGQIASWSLYGPWGTLASGTAAVGPGTLGTQPAAGHEGPATFFLTATDRAGWGTGDMTTLYFETSRRGTEPYYTTVPFDLGGGLAMAVGTANGELTLDRAAFAIPSYGPPQALTLHYSSLETTHSGRLGYGWISNLTQYLTSDSGFLVWHRADGGIEPFANLGGTWTPGPGHFETLTHQSGPGTYTITAKDQSQLVFADTSPYRLTAVKDRLGNTLSLTWSTSSASATDAAGRATSIVINSANDRLTSVTDSAGRAWNFGYDANQQLATLTDPLSAVTTFAYDTNNRLTSVSRSRSRNVGSPETILWSIAYDSAGRVASITDPMAAQVSSSDTIAYTPTTTTVSLAKDADSVETSVYTLDDAGRVTALLDPERWTHAWTYDADGNVLSATSPIDASTSATTTYTYDARGNHLSATTPIDGSSSVSSTWTYNSGNDVTNETDAAGTAIERQTAYTYTDGHLTATEINPQLDDGPDGQVTTSYTYTGHDQLETTTDALGRVTKSTYDANGNVLSTIQNYLSGSCTQSDCNVETANTYDANTTAGRAGLVTSQTDPSGATTSATYDDLGRVLTLSAAADTGVPATITTNIYDELGNLLRATVSGDGESGSTTHVYNLLNAEISVTDATGVSVSVTTDLMGNTQTVTPPATDATTTMQDALNRIISEQSSSALQTQQTTNAAGDVTSHRQVTDGASVVDSQVLRTYDLAGHLMTETEDPDGANLTASYTYDVLGETLSETAPDGNVTRYAYDRLGRLCRQLDNASAAGAFTCTSTVTGTATTNLLTTYSYDKMGRQLMTSGPAAVGETPSATATVYDNLDRATQTIANYVQGSQDSDANIASGTYYDRAGRVTATSDALDIVTRSIFNDRGWVVRSIVNCTDTGFTPSPDPANCTGVGTHDGATNVVTDTAYDDAGNTLTTTVRDPSNSAHDIVTTFSYDGAGRPTAQVVDAGDGKLNLTTEYAYDEAGREIATRDPEGTVTRSIYDGQGNLRETIDNCTDSGTTLPTTNWADCAGTGTADATWNRVTAYAYGELGEKVWEQAPNGRVTTYAYDNTGRLVSQTDNAVIGTPNPDENLVTTYAYDDAGNQIGVRAPTADNATFSVTATVYDASGNKLEEIANCTDDGMSVPEAPVCTGDGTHAASTNIETFWTYDSAGQNVTQTGPDPSDDADGTDTVTTAYAYGRLGRLCRTVANATIDLGTLTHPCTDAVSGDAATNVSVRYGYDRASHKTSVTDGNGNSESYAYDALGRMTSRTDADAATVHWSYDVRGNKIQQINRVNPPYAQVTWTYDAADRLISRTANSVTATYTYDATGNQLTATSPAGTITASYDRAHRVTSVVGDDSAETVYTYGFDTAARSDPSGAYSFSLDHFGRETSATIPDPNTYYQDPLLFSWRADGHLASSVRDSYDQYWQIYENATIYAYDSLGRLMASEADATTVGQGDPVVLASYGYTYNRAGQQLSEDAQVEGSGANGLATFAYDPLGRLTDYGSPLGSPHDQAYAWQAVPNRASVATGGGTQVTSTYDNANRLTDTGYAYNADGERTARPGETLVWDDLGRLTGVDDANTHEPISTYTYDALDRLRTVTRGDSTIRFVYVGLTAQVAQEVDGDETPVLDVANSWSGTRLADWDADAVSRYYGIDSHGDLTWWIDSSDPTNVAGSARYDAWGIVIDQAGEAIGDWQFAMAWVDGAVGLAWHGHRWYDAQTAAYLSPDQTTLAQTHDGSAYTYGGGDPLSATGGHTSDPQPRSRASGTGGGDSGVTASEPMVYTTGTTDYDYHNCKNGSLQDPNDENRTLAYCHLIGDDVHPDPRTNAVVSWITKVLEPPSNTVNPTFDKKYNQSNRDDKGVTYGHEKLFANMCSEGAATIALWTLARSYKPVTSTQDIQDAITALRARLNGLGEYKFKKKGAYENLAHWTFWHNQTNHGPNPYNGRGIMMYLAFDEVPIGNSNWTEPGLIDWTARKNGGAWNTRTTWLFSALNKEASGIASFTKVAGSGSGLQTAQQLYAHVKTSIDKGQAVIAQVSTKWKKSAGLWEGLYFWQNADPVAHAISIFGYSYAMEFVPSEVDIPVGYWYVDTCGRACMQASSWSKGHHYISAGVLLDLLHDEVNLGSNNKGDGIIFVGV